jgi:Fe-Mn family superoxide dismutase
VKLDRREFLRLAGLSAMAGSLAKIGIAGTGPEGGQSMAGQHQLPPLPYAYDALEPYYDKETLTLHHDKHHQAYVTGLNNAELAVDKMLSEGNFAAAEATARALAFHGSGHFLHSIFWTNMKPGGGGAPSGALADAITKSFGSVEACGGLFLAATNAVAGSGWGILAYRKMDDALVILQAEKHENLTQWGVTPVLVLDVWEHAYYLKYQNKRPDWTKAFMEHLVNWDNVAERLAAAKG